MILNHYFKELLTFSFSLDIQTFNLTKKIFMKKLLFIPFLISLFHINTVHAGCWDMFRKADPVHIAVEMGNVEKLKKLIEEKFDLEVLDAEGRAPIHRAAANALVPYRDARFDPKIMQLLIDAGVDVNIKDKDGKAPLHHASEELKATALLIKHGANVHAVDLKGRAPIHYASFSTNGRLFFKNGAEDNLGVVQLLIDAGADVNARDADGETPLHFARHSKRVLELLLDHDAEMEALNKKGKIPRIIRDNPVLDLLEDGFNVKRFYRFSDNKDRPFT